MRHAGYQPDDFPEWWWSPDKEAKSPQTASESPQPTSDSLESPSSLPQSEAVSPLSRDDINLLGKHGIVRDPTGVWYHIEEEPSGRTTITPVNCYTNLKTTPVQGDAILQNVCRHVRALM